MFSFLTLRITSLDDLHNNIGKELVFSIISVIHTKSRMYFAKTSESKFYKELIILTGQICSKYLRNM